MTPLAHSIAKQALLPARKRKLVFEKQEIVDPASLVSDIHCFECTEVFDLACDLNDSGRLTELGSERFFLPAPRTWIEHRYKGTRTAWLISEDPFVFQMIVDAGDRFGLEKTPLWSRDEHTMAGLVLSMLAIINTPRIVGRDVFQPHRQLARLWMTQLKKTPLNAWHELKLNIAKPADIDDDEPHAAQITGRRALHFCRAHLRVRLGRLEFVTSHYRGDPSLGEKLTRYRVAH